MKIPVAQEALSNAKKWLRATSNVGVNDAYELENDAAGHFGACERVVDGMADEDAELGRSPDRAGGRWSDRGEGL